MALSEERGSISRRMVVVFLSTFALTTLGFMGATLVLRIKAERILADSAAISGNAVPSMQRLSSARTTLRHLEVTLDDYVDHSVLTSGPQQESPTIAEDRQFLREQWDAYMALPTFPQERSLWPSISSELRELDGTVNRLLEDLRAGTTEDVEAGWDGDTKRLFDQLDARFYDALLLNAAGSAEAAGDIGGVEHDLRTISTTLNVLCALFALFAAYIAVRVFRQYAQVTEDQIGNLELFAGRVAHDLRAPLSSVSLAIQYAREHATEPRMKNVLSRAHRTLQRTGELVDGLMLLAQLVRSGGAGAHSDVKIVVEDLIDELEPLARDHQVTLELGRIPPIEVACSAGVLANMVGNLVGNAIKHMGDSAVRRVAVAAEARNEVVRIEVHDTGPGIPTASQGTVFDVYARAAPSGISGLGLGLATVRRLAEVLGGRVGLESGTPAGSVFWIELPKARAGEKRAEQPATQSGVFRPIGRHLRALAAGRPAPRP